MSLPQAETNSASVNAPLPVAPTQARVAPLRETWVSLARWAHNAGLPAPLCLATGPACLYELRLPQGRLVLRTGSLLARWNGLELHLGFAPQLIGGQLFLHALDFQKSVQPLLTNIPQFGSEHDPVLVIDPGHGGTDAGTKSAVESRYEKEFTLDWALRLEALLATNHWQVFLTRTTDTDIALSNRVAFAESRKADLFLSLHFNAAGADQGDGGLETYCLTPAGMPSSLTRGYPDDLTLIFPNNAFDEGNLQWAVRLHRALLDINGHHDRGVRRARFTTVLRGQQRPAVLIEGGYLSNAREAHLIADPAYRQKLAEALARALADAVDLGRQNESPGT